MNLNCPHCDRPIPGENINVQTSIAKCACGAVFGFADKVPGAAPYGPYKRLVAMPQGYSVSHEGAGLVIVHRWLSLKFVALLVFSLLWDGFLVLWYFLAFTKDGSMMMKLFPVLHVAVGVVLTYVAIAGLFNHTRVNVSMAELDIKHFPLPWPGARVVTRDSISQLFSEEKIYRGKNAPYSTYDLSAVMRDGSRLTLVAGLDKPEDALFLEQQVESYLGITDKPVPGEMRPV